MKPTILISVALAGGIASAQFVTSVTQAQPAVSDVAALELRQAGTTTTTADQETTTTKKTTTTTSPKTTATTSKPTTTATTTGTTKTTSRTTTATGQTTTTHSTSTTAGQTAGSGQTDNGATDIASSTSAAGSDGATGAPGSSNQNDGTGNNNNTNTQSKGLSAGAAAGIAVGAVLGALAIAGAAFFFWRKRRGGVRGAIVTAERPEMSDPFGRHGPQPTLPVVAPSPGPSHPSPGMSHAYSVSAPSESSTAYSNNANHNWGPGAGAGAGAAAAGYAQPPRGNGYRPLSFEESPESVATYGHNSYQRLLPAEEVPHQPQGHDRYERLGQEEAGQIHSPGVGHFDAAALDERHSNLPAFMIPGGNKRKPSLPGGQPVPKIEVQTASPIVTGRHTNLPSQGQGRVELPG